MHVLHVIAGVAPRYGGPSTTIWPMVTALGRTPGVTATLATTDADGPGGRIDPAALPADVPVRLFRRTFSEQWKYSPGLGRWLRRHAKDFDVVHVHGIWSYCNAVAARAAERAGVPYVVRPAGMLSEYCLNSRAFKKRLYWALVEGRTIRRAAGFHVTGEDEVRDVRAVRPDARTFLIPQAIDADAFAAPVDPHGLRKRCGDAAGDRPIVLFLGRLHPVKGLADLLLPAFSRLRTDAFLAIAGGPDAQAPGYDQTVREAIGRLGLAGRVALLGPVPPAGRWQLFDGAAAFVLPSHSENFGMVVAEAMARGCPVVVTEAVQAHPHVTAAGAGRVVPCHPGALADALEDQLTHAAARARLGDAGRRYVRSQLTWDRVAERLHGMYQSLAAGR
jgi:glycosyltransferase involved in cell wall biosynthesis